MFSTNQIFDISCEKEDLAKIIDLAFEMEGKDPYTRKKGRVNAAFATPGKELYLIGSGSMEPYSDTNKGYGCPKGWQDYPFAYDPNIIAEIVGKWADEQEYPTEYGPDGGESKGLRVMCYSSAYDEIPAIRELSHDGDFSRHNTVLAICPKWMFYAK